MVTFVGKASEPLEVSSNSYTSTGDNPLQETTDEYWQAKPQSKNPYVKFASTTPEQPIWLDFWVFTRYSKSIDWKLKNDDGDIVDSGVSLLQMGYSI